jgi:hypothetical protein
MKKAILFAALWMVTACAITGATGQPGLDDQQSEQKDASAPASGGPKKEMNLLYPRIGTWHVTIRTEPSKDSPHGGVDKGTMTMTKGPGGFSVVQEFWSRGSSGNIKGQSYAWWDDASKTYKSVWCDNMQGCTEFVTVINGRSWTAEFHSEADGKKVHTVIQATMSADLNAIHEEVKSSYDGGLAKLESVSEYVRVATGTGAKP